MDRRHWVLALLMGGIHFSFHLFMRLVPPLIPVLAVGLALPLWRLGLLVSVYFAGSSAGLLPMGVLSDRYDRRTVLSLALVVVVIGYAVFAAAPSLESVQPGIRLGGHAFGGQYLAMLFGMFLAGVGTSAHVPVGVPLLTANADVTKRGRLLGIWGGASKLGDAATPAIVGVLILAVAWQEIVVGFAVLGLVLALGLYLVLSLGQFDTSPPPEPDEAEPPWRGDRRQYVYPMLVLMGYFAAYNVVVQGVITFTPTFVADIYGYTFDLAGVHFAPESFADFALSVLLIAAAISRFTGGILVDRFEGRAVLVGSLALATVSLYLLSVATLGPLVLMVVLAVFGAGLWGNSPARDSLISELTPADREGRTFSYLWTASRMFAAVSPVLIGLMADTVGIRTGFRYLAFSTFVATAFTALLFSDRIYVEGRSGSGNGVQ